MTRQRANEIERRVFYSVLGSVVPQGANPDDMFYVGHSIGIMHQKLRSELENEIDEDDEE